MDRSFLELWSREWVVAHDPDTDRPLDDEVRSGWLGFAPATEEAIAAAERRLGIRLPPSLRSFLVITDGWKDAGCFVHRLAGTAEPAWTCTPGSTHCASRRARPGTGGTPRWSARTGPPWPARSTVRPRCSAPPSGSAGTGPGSCASSSARCKRDWTTVRLVHLLWPDLFLLDDPLFEAELLPLLYVERQLPGTREQFTLTLLRQRPAYRARLADGDARR